MLRLVPAAPHPLARQGFHARQGFTAPRRLGQQVVETPFQVVVTDIRGTPFQDAMVTAFVNGQRLYDVKTGHEGIASFPPAKGGVITVRVEAQGYIINRQVESTDETLFISLPVCASQSLLTITEMGILAASGALIWAGSRWKTDVAKTVGELGLGAVIFSAVYRHSCGG